ncbi:hypothetical protein [Kushneria phyllosphaerae]|uniref:Tail fiber assembly protein n=1 Tax=Kushneria phyllosphaerae TaxID=2100822 RepID=A0A2R8CQS7_9GAMM|nr:hypothetical protein [Kushneria phyllosphaerae]SPJ35247.1 hypothetical protein KSP9073_03305 [Kushneria phyllosphaerae]
MKYFYSAERNMLYPSTMRGRYEAAGTWPDDAREVDKATYEEFVGDSPAGMRRGSSDEGLPCWVALDPDPVDARKAAAINWLDATADRIRASDRSVGQYLDAEYQLVAQALIEYRTNPEGEVPDAIRSYAAAEGLTVEAAAQQIAEAAARVQELLQDVRRIRLAGKAAIRDAGDDADMMEAARPFIDQLEALAIQEQTDN